MIFSVLKGLLRGLFKNGTNRESCYWRCDITSVFIRHGFPIQFSQFDFDGQFFDDFLDNHSKKLFMSFVKKSEKIINGTISFRLWRLPGKMMIRLITMNDILARFVSNLQTDIFSQLLFKPSCNPNSRTGSFPFFIILSTIIQITVFCYHSQEGQITISS